VDCRGSDLNRRIGRTQLAEVWLGAKPDCFCLVGVELQATASAPEISVEHAVRQASSKRVDDTGATAVIELGVVSVHVGPYGMSVHQVDNILSIWYEAYWTKDIPLQSTGKLDVCLPWCVKSWVRRSTLGKLFTRVLSQQAVEFGTGPLAKGRLCSAPGKLTAGLMAVMATYYSLHRIKLRPICM